MILGCTSRAECSIIRLAKALATHFCGIEMLVFGFFNLFWSIVVIRRHVDWSDIGVAAKVVVRIVVYADIIVSGLLMIAGISVFLMKVIFVLISFGNPKRAIREHIELVDCDDRMVG